MSAIKKHLQKSSTFTSDGNVVESERGLNIKGKKGFQEKQDAGRIISQWLDGGSGDVMKILLDEKGNRVSPRDTGREKQTGRFTEEYGSSRQISIWLDKGSGDQSSLNFGFAPRRINKQ